MAEYTKSGREGEIINGYNIVKLISLGEYAHSYLAEKDGKNYFLKIYQSINAVNSKDKYPKFYNHQKEIKKFLDSNLEIKNVTVPMLDLFEYDDCCVEVFPYLPGLDLKSFIDDPKKSDYKRRWYFATIFVSALEVLHRNNLIHSDLKPPQIFLVEDTSIKIGYKCLISDFDFSILKGISEPVFYVGTPIYFSPEYLEKNEVKDFKSDIFTAGIILYELLLYRCPWEDMDDNLENAKNRKPFNPRELDKRISNKVEDILLRCLKYDLNERPTAKELMQIFQDEINHKIPPFDLPNAKEDIELKRKPPEVIPPKPAPAPIPPIKEINKWKITWRGKELLIWKPQIVTKHSLRIISIDLYNVCSNNVFEIKKEGNIWKIKGFAPEAGKKPVFLNGKDITNIDVAINNGDILKIGDIELKIEMQNI